MAMRKIPATFHGSVAQAVGMMFIVAVLMLAFIAQANDSYLQKSPF
ncbi:hypothetical protein E5L41_04675 [Helicobacter pylori]|nr:hypothetical protein E5L41_04675 [Helicobacter pylori]